MCTCMCNISVIGLVKLLLICHCKLNCEYRYIGMDIRLIHCNVESKETVFSLNYLFDMLHL